MDILTILVFLQYSLDFQLIILNVLLINGSESRNFRFYHDSYQSSPMMNRIKYFQFRWDSLLYVLDHEIQILTLRSKKFSLSELQLLYFKFSPKMDVFTHKRILHEYSFKRNQRPATCSILTLWCASHCWVILHGVHHTAESYFTVCIPLLSHTLRCASLAESYFTVCIPLLSHTSRCASHYRIKSFNNNKTRRCASHSGVRLVGVRHAVESDPRIAS